MIFIGTLRPDKYIMDWNDIGLAIFEWVQNHFIAIIVAIFIFIERKTLYNALFLQPIRGGNGVTQMDELAKYVIVVLLVAEWATKRDPVIMGELLGGVFAIAGLKHLAEKKKKHEQTSEH